MVKSVEERAVLLEALAEQARTGVADRLRETVTERYKEFMNDGISISHIFSLVVLDDPHLEREGWVFGPLYHIKRKITGSLQIRETETRKKIQDHYKQRQRNARSNSRFRDDAYMHRQQSIHAEANKQTNSDEPGLTNKSIYFENLVGAFFDLFRNGKLIATARQNDIAARFEIERHSWNKSLGALRPRRDKFWTGSNLEKKADIVYFDVRIKLGSLEIDKSIKRNDLSVIRLLRAADEMAIVRLDRRVKEYIQSHNDELSGAGIPISIVFAALVKADKIAQNENWSDDVCLSLNVEKFEYRNESHDSMAVHLRTLSYIQNKSSNSSALEFYLSQSNGDDATRFISGSLLVLVGGFFELFRNGTLTSVGLRSKTGEPVKITPHYWRNHVGGFEPENDRIWSGVDPESDTAVVHFDVHVKLPTDLSKAAKVPAKSKKEEAGDAPVRRVLEKIYADESPINRDCLHKKVKETVPAASGRQIDRIRGNLKKPDSWKKPGPKPNKKTK